MLGYHNHLVVSLGYQGQITGNANLRAIACPSFVLPFRARLVGVSAVSTAISSAGTAFIYILANGTSVLTTYLTLTNADPHSASATILGDYVKHEAGTIFTIKENTTNSKTLDNPSVQLWFRSLTV